MRPRRFHFSKPGIKPNPIVVRELKRKHPTVRLMWAKIPDHGVIKKRWVLVQIQGNRMHLIRVLEQDGQFVKPTLDNTVRVLINPARLTNRFELERFLGALDISYEDAQQQVDEKHRDRVLEGHNRMHHEIVKPTFVVPSPSQPRIILP